MADLNPSDTSVQPEAADADPALPARLVAATSDLDGPVADLLVACADEIVRLRELTRWVCDQLTPLALTQVLRMGGDQVGDAIPHHLGDTARRVWPDNQLIIEPAPSGE